MSNVVKLEPRWPDGITAVDEALSFADITSGYFADKPQAMLLSDQAVVVLAAEVRRLMDELAMWDR